MSRDVRITEIRSWNGMYLIPSSVVSDHRITMIVFYRWSLLSLYKALILHNVKSTAHKQAHVSIVASNNYSKQICEHYHLHLISSHDESNNSNSLHLVNCKETIGNY